MEMVFVGYFYTVGLLIMFSHTPYCFGRNEESRKLLMSTESKGKEQEGGVLDIVLTSLFSMSNSFSVAQVTDVNFLIVRYVCLSLITSRMLYMFF